MTAGSVCYLYVSSGGQWSGLSSLVWFCRMSTIKCLITWTCLSAPDDAEKSHEKRVIRLKEDKRDWATDWPGDLEEHTWTILPYVLCWDSTIQNLLQTKPLKCFHVFRLLQAGVTYSVTDGVVLYQHEDEGVGGHVSVVPWEVFHGWGNNKCSQWNISNFLCNFTVLFISLQ